MKLNKALMPIVVMVAMLFSSAWVSAELRVVVQYDAEGHSLLRAVEIDDSAKQTRQPAGNALGHPAYQAAVKWFSADGTLLHTDSIADPRLIHAPLNKSGEAPQMIGLGSGAYMVSGPNGSAVLEVSLPANPSLGLYSHTVRFNLDLN